MRFAVIVLLVAAMGLAGCDGSRDADSIEGGPRESIVADGLSVTLEAPRRALRMGETLRLEVTVRNTTRRTIEIAARSGAPVYARLSRHTGLFWEQFKSYPAAATMVMTPWTLDRGRERRFILTLPVEPDWPAGERLRITAEVNGRPAPQPSITVRVIPPQR